ncbi:MAG: ABC transporter ATP-binding protein, partial [Planctomycetes bacterium]|nr:ABC transporter ATP-binding protein [Planctomycetota bacterium]
MNYAIQVDQLGKRYRVGEGGVRADYRTLRETLSGALRAPLRRRRDSVRDFWALNEVSFGIPPGEAVGIVGRNGAGKSTLLKIISRITAPTTGEVLLRGRVGSLLEVGTGFHQELTGRENIFLNGAILGMSRREIQRRFEEIVEFSGVAPFLDTPVKRFSSGMYVRLAFAVAAHLDVEILLIDEVLAVGDVEFQRRCLQRMETAARSGRTVLFVSHNLAAVQAFCRRCVLLKEGRVEFIGEAEEAIDRYLKGLETEQTVGRFQASQDAETGRREDVRLEEARITSAGEFCETGYAIGAPLEIEITYAARRSVPAPRMVVCLNNAFGQRITTFHSVLSDPPFA